MKTTTLLLSLLLSLFMLTACGDDDDSSGGGSTSTPAPGPDPVPQPEEAPEEACLTEEEELQVEQLFDRIWNTSTQVGTAEVRTINEDGSYTTTNYSGNYDFSEENAMWIIEGTFCEIGTENCFDVRSEADILNGCLVYDDQTTEVQSVSENSITFTRENEDASETVSTLSIDESDGLQVNETDTLSGTVQSDFTFEPVL